MKLGDYLNEIGLLVSFGGAAWLWREGLNNGGGGLGAYANDNLIEKVRAFGKARKRKQDYAFYLTA